MSKNLLPNLFQKNPQNQELTLKLQNLLSEFGFDSDTNDVLVGNIKSLVQEKLEDLCNQCGNKLGPYWSIKYKTTWGYFSTKDGDSDSWKLCSPCSEAFQIQNPIKCCKCLLTLDEIAATISSKDENCSYFGNYSEAMKSQSQHQGSFGFANIEGRIFCELCYEDLVLSFKIPALTGSPGFGGTIDEQITESRITKALKKRE